MIASKLSGPYFETILHLPSISHDLFLLFSRSCQAKVAIQSTFCVGTATVLSVTILKRHDDHILGLWWWSKCNLGQRCLVNVSSGHAMSCAFFAHNILQKRDRTMRMVSLCSAGQNASIDGVFIVHLRSLGDLKVTCPEVT